MKRKVIIGLLAVVLLSFAVYVFMQLPRPAKITLKFPETVSLNQEIEVPLVISVGQSINAAEFYFQFPSDLIEVVGIDQEGSFFELWIKDYPRFDNKLGLIELAGGLPNPGFEGSEGLIATVKFRVIKTGQGSIGLDEDRSRILANDGLGTNIESIFEPIAFRAK